MPDLIIVDGGIGHLSVANKIINMLDIEIPIVCMAKGRKRNALNESFFIKNKKPFKIAHRDTLNFLQNLRDNAHRSAINTYRKNIKHKMSVSILDDVSGIGHIRKRLLLKYYGTIENIALAEPEDIASVVGISVKNAVNLLNTINNYKNKQF